MSGKPDGEVPQRLRESDSGDQESAIDNTLPHEVFNPKLSAESIVEKARDIQQLLKTYESNTKTLKEDIAEFVVREVHEENKLKTIAVTVANDELLSLKNMDYVKYVHNRKAVAVHNDDVMQTARMRFKSGAKDEKLDSTVEWTHAKSSWTPDGAVALRAFGDLHEVFLGWRSTNSASEKSFNELRTLLFGSQDTSLCCFFGGHLFTPSSAGVDEYVPERKAVLAKDFAEYFASEHDKTPSQAVSSAIQVFTNFLVMVSSLTGSAFAKCLRDAQPKHEDRDEEDPQRGIRNFRPQLVGDSEDSLVVVDPRRLYNSQTFRAFFIGGDLVAVEHMGWHADVLHFLCCDPAQETTRARPNYYAREKQRILATFRMLFAVFCADRDNNGPSSAVVVTAALSAESLPADVNGGVEAVHSSGVVLDIRNVTPSIPFRWHFSWPEICVLGQLHSRSTASSSSSPQGSSASVVFKAASVAVAELQPYDQVSAIYAPVLNELIASASSGTTLNSWTHGASVGSSEAATAGERRQISFDARELAKVAGVLTAVSTAAAGLAFFLKRR